MKTDLSLRKRLIVIDIMVPVVVGFAFLGGWPFALFVSLVAGIAAWELWRLFKTNGYSAALPVILPLTFLAPVLSYATKDEYFPIWLAAVILVSLFWHTIRYQSGVKTGAIDFMITIGVIVYLGWLSSYAVAIRALPDGLFWLLIIFPVISLADTGAYLFGRPFGKHKMMPAVSPKKSWEGFLGGILVGTLSGWGLAAMWHLRVAEILPLHGIIIGLVISTLAPFGDFAESMIKRQFGVKDSSNFLLEHGGFLDRIDSSLWAAPIGYYLIHLFLP